MAMNKRKFFIETNFTKERNFSRHILAGFVNF